MIDLRSDTVTKPSQRMRRAIADAAVGDDVYHDDPTVNELEGTVADLLGKDDAVFVPTGTMSNQIALRIQTNPGDTVLIHAEAHIGQHELGGAAHNSGVTLARLVGPYGTFSAEQVADSVPTPHAALPGHLFAPVTLMCLENTHNDSGGTVWDTTQTQEVLNTARSLGLKTHLDGARLWNASAASGVDLVDLALGFDTVNVCFSKGLGAPVGSALAGAADTIEQARRFKQIFGVSNTTANGSSMTTPTHGPSQRRSTQRIRSKWTSGPSRRISSTSRHPTQKLSQATACTREYRCLPWAEQRSEPYSTSA